MLRFIKFILLLLTFFFFVGGYAFKLYYYISYNVKLKGGFGLTSISQGKANIKLILTLHNKNLFNIKLHDFKLKIFDKDKNLLAETKERDVEIDGRSKNTYTFDVKVMLSNDFLTTASKAASGTPVLIKYQPNFKIWGFIPIWFTSSYKLTEEDVG